MDEDKKYWEAVEKSIRRRKVEAEAGRRMDRGLAVLNHLVPGWIEKIDMESFDWGNECYCVVAQLFNNDYLLGLQALGIPYEDTSNDSDYWCWPRYFGFDAPGELEIRKILSRWWHNYISNEQMYINLDKEGEEHED
jgi:hypothetical protein